MLTVNPTRSSVVQLRGHGSRSSFGHNTPCVQECVSLACIRAFRHGMRAYMRVRMWVASGWIRCTCVCAGVHVGLKHCVLVHLRVCPFRRVVMLCNMERACVCVSVCVSVCTVCVCIYMYEMDEFFSFGLLFSFHPFVILTQHWSFVASSHCEDA